MDVRRPLYQAIASSLIGILFLNPIVAAAAELAVEAAAGSNTSIGAAGNGVPVVNIATPNGAGLSHNKFTDYNVGQQGLILNNATQAQVTQLGGTIDANGNLGGRAANKILNEVTGGNPSQLRGYTEVAGQSAHVIVANPHGITCDGCGFINTPRATLTTGKPLMDGERLRGYDIDGGEIAIEGAGLNASNIDKFELITRSAKLNAELYARQLDVVTGRNQVDADSLAATTKADDGTAKPQLAIDSSALGGMYAGAIRLVGTEQGVGVKLAGDMAASAGDIQIDAQGKVSVAQTASRGDLRIKAPDVAFDGPAYAAGAAQIQTAGTLSNAQSLAAGSSLSIDAAHVENAGALESGVNADGSRNDHGDLHLHAESLRNTGALVATRRANVLTQNEVDNRSGVMAAAELKLDAAHLDNRGGALLGERSLKLKGQSTDNRDHGLIQSRGALAIELTSTLDNSFGELLALGRFDLQAQNLVNHQGVVFGQQGMAMNLGSLDNRSGQINSAQQAQIQVQGDALNQNGELSADGGLMLKAHSLRNGEQGRIVSLRGLTLNLDELHNNGGWIQTSGELLLAAGYVNNFSGHLQSLGELSWAGSTLDNRGGEIQARGSLTFEGTSLLNHDGLIYSQDRLLGQLLELQQHEGRIVADGAASLLANSLENSQNSLIASNQSLGIQSFDLTNVQGGEIASLGKLSLRTDRLDNSNGGRINSADDFTLRANRILNQAGILSSGGRLDLLGTLLDNRNGGLVASSKGMSLRLGEQVMNQGGRVSTGAELLLASPRVDNSAGGQIAAGGALTLQTEAMNNAGGLLQIGGGLNLTGDHLDNREGNLVGAGQMHLDFTSVDNRGGRLGSEDDLILDAQTIDNTEQGELLAGKSLKVTGDTLDNRTGRIYAGTSGELNLTHLDNRQGSVEGRGDLLLKVAQVNNQDGGRLTSERRLDLFVQSLLNHSGVIRANQFLGIQGDSLNNGSGQIFAGGALLNLAQLDNRNGSIQASERLQMDGNTLLNGGGQLASGGELQIEAKTIDNREGELLAGGAVRIQASEQLDVSGGKLHGVGDVQARAAQILNRDGGEIASAGSLTLSADALDNRQGLISSEALATLDVKRMDNRGGVASGQNLIATFDALDNRWGILGAADSATLQANAQDNRQGEISAKNLQLSAAELNNQGGRVLGTDTLSLFVKHLLNQAGVVSSEGHLRLDAGTGDNTAGLVHADGLLTVTADVLTNTGGEISSGSNQDLHVGTLDNHGGYLLAEGALHLQADQLNNDAGHLYTRKALDVMARQLNNQQGELASAGSLSVQADDLDNTRGAIQSQGELQLRVSQHLENAQGVIGGVGIDLQSNTLGNREGVISSGADLLIHGAELDNSNGQLITNGKLTLETDSLDNSRGSISAQGDLNLTTQLLKQQTGQILSLGQLALFADRIDNDGGRIAGTGPLMLHTSELNNLAGTISAGGTLDITTQRLDNHQGVIGAQDTSTLKADSLDNRTGVITGNGELNIAAQQMDNREGGQVSAQGNLAIVGGELDNRGGMVAGGQDVTLTLERLLNAGGKITAAQWLKLSVADLQQGNGILDGGSLLLDMRGKNFDNTGGRLSTTGSLSIVNVRQLTNTDGEISAGGDLSVGNTFILHNGAGLIRSGRDLFLNAENIDNDGVVESGRDLYVQGDSTVYNYRDGIISAVNDGSIAGYAFHNLGGQLLTGGNLRFSPLLIENTDGGLIQSGKNLTADALVLDNRGGSLIANNAAKLTVRDRIDNQDGGSIASGDQLVIRTNELDNQNGEINAQSDLRLYVERLLQKQGKLFAGGDLELELQGKDGDLNLDNSAGVISANGHLTLRNLHDLNNQGGILASQQDIDLAFHDLDNSNGGLVAGSKAVSLILNDLRNQAGSVSSQKDLTLQLHSLDNHLGGLLDSAKGSVDLRTEGSVNNREGGLIQGNDLSLDIAGGLDNTQGTLSAVTGNLTLTTPTVDNTGGGLYAYENLILRSDNLINTGDSLASGGRIGAGALDLQLAGHLDNHNGLIEAAEKFDISATSLDNQGGYLRDLGEDGATRFQIGGLLDNRNGTIESANHDIRFAIGSLANQGGRILHAGTGEFGLSSQNIFQAGGLFGTNGLMTLQADSWVNDTIVRAGRLSLDIGEFRQTANGKLLAADGLIGIGDNWVNDGVIATDGDLNLGLSGAYSGGGLLSSLGDLSVSALIVDINQGGSIAGGRNVDIHSTDIENEGRITAAQDLTLSGDRFNNGGTIGSARTLAITARTLNNNSGLIFSGSDMTLRADTLSNYHADLYSLANLTHLGWAGGQAQSLDNASGRISSVGDTSINAASLTNRRDDDNTSAMFDVGGSLSFAGSSFVNLDSQVFAGRDISISAQTFNNRGTSDTPAIVQAGGLVSINASQRLGNGEVIENASAANPNRTPGNTDAVSLVAPIDINGSRLPTRVVPNLDLPQGGMFHLVDVNGGGQGNDGNGPEVPASYQPGGTTVPGAQSYASDWQMADGVAGEALSNLGVRVAVDGSKAQVAPPKGLNADGSAKRPGADVLAVSLSSGENLAVVDYTGVDVARFVPAAAGINGVPGSNWSAPSHKYLIYTDPLIPGGNPGDGGGTTGEGGNGGGNIDTGSTGDGTGGQPSGGQGSSPGKPATSSDYLLALLGYDPDRAQKRLGDGLYEQYLISQALIAKTGKRFLDGFNSDAAVFRYLMDNAIAYKDRLQLTLGVALTAEQVAALTHDIVWMEEVEVNGEKVLVPVLYMANAEGHLMADGSLIQGRDLTLISGGELANSGTLRASDNLDITAKSLANRGAITAGQTLDASIEGNIHNAANAIIKGRDGTISAGGVIDNRGALVGENSLALSGESLDNRGWIDGGQRLDAAVTDGIHNRANATIKGADLTVISQNGALVNEKGASITAGDNLDITAKNLENSGQITAGQYLDVQVEGNLQNAANAIIKGRDGTISAGGVIDNRGALVGENSLALSGESLDNRGWIDGGQRLDAAVTNDLHNRSGATIQGRDVNIDAQNGSLINEQGAQLRADRDLNAVAGSDIRNDSQISAGRNATVIGTGDVLNNGSLKAGENLGVVGKNVDNHGQIESGERLDVLAQDSIHNREGASIKGGDVSLTALTGDITNERSRSTQETTGKKETRRDDSVGPGAGIEASGKLAIDAGRDFINTANPLTAGGDLDINAGRDLLITSLSETHERRSSNGNDRNSSVTQHQAEVSAGGSVSMHAGRDAALIATPVNAGGDIALSAGRDVNLLSAADEAHSYSRDPSGSKKSTRQKDHVEQLSSELNAQGDLLVSAGNNITLVSSKISAGNEAYLVAGNKLNVLAATDSDYSLYDMKKKSSWGRKKTQHDESTHVVANSSEIKAGGPVTLLSGGDQHYQAAVVDSGDTINIVSGGKVIFEAAKDVHQESHNKSSSNLAWNSAKGKGNTNEALRQTQLIAQNGAAISAVEGLQIDYKQLNKKSVSQAIDAMVKADPGLAWIKEAEARGDVDWRAVQEMHDSYKYSNSGLGQGAMLAIVIVVTYLTAGAASGAIGSAAGATAGSGSAMAAGTAATATTAATSAGWANVALTAVATSAASQATISTINNRGDLGAVAKDVTSNDALKNYAAAGISAGYSPNNIGLQLSVNAALKTVTQGGSFKDNLGQAAIDMIADAVSGAIYEKVGNSLVGTGLSQKVAVHALVGGLIAEAAGGDFRTGAMAAGANEAVVDTFGKEIFPGEQHEKLLAMTSNLIGMTVAAGAGGDDKAQEKAGWVAQQATAYNYLDHVEVDAMGKELLGCRGTGDPSACRDQVQEKFQALNDQKTGAALYGCKGESEAVCSGQYSAAKGGSGQLDRLMNLASFTEEEKDILGHFQDINHNDQRVADHAWLQSFWQESGAAGGVLSAVGPSMAFRMGAGEAKVMANGAPVVSRATTGIEWGKGIQAQGMSWENYLASQLPAGSRLPANFRTFDFFEETSGLAISAKTLDTTTAAKLANPRQVYSSLKTNIDDVVKFKEARIGEQTLNSSQIASREVHVAVPKATIPAQWVEINKAAQYAEGLGVKLKVTVIE